MQNFAQIIKVWWMVFWRAAILEPVLMGRATVWPFLIAVAVSLILVLAAGRTIKIFPIIRAIRRENAFPVINTDGNTPRSSQSHPVTFSQPGGGASTYPSTLAAGGRVSPGGNHEHSPRALEPLPEPSGQNMYGRPGRSLSAAQGISAANAQSGALGEKNFAKALAVEGLINRCVSLWSVKMPGKIGFTPDPVLNTDIDCILFYDNTILLLDMKLYTGGDITYFNSGGNLIRMNNKTGVTSGAPIPMSKNMQIAHERFMRLYPNYSVYAMVVFMPTDRGSATLNNVTWPGNVPAVNLDEMIDYLRGSLPARLTPSSQPLLALPLLA